jgi:hypothetical protein
MLMCLPLNLHRRAVSPEKMKTGARQKPAGHVNSLTCLEEENKWLNMCILPVVPAPVTIKKYANRRLYNTATSTYVTLENLAAMVKEGTEFNVYDAKKR